MRVVVHFGQEAANSRDCLFLAHETLFFENGAAPVFWDGSTITLSNVTEPIGLENMGLPPGIGYTPLAFVVDDYITISGTLRNIASAIRTIP